MWGIYSFPRAFGGGLPVPGGLKDSMLSNLEKFMAQHNGNAKPMMWPEEESAEWEQVREVALGVALKGQAGLEGGERTG